MIPSERIILALDVDNSDDAIRLVEGLREKVGAFKVGLELVNAVGPEIFAKMRTAGASRIFYDCKLHDIPNTVAGAIRAITRHELWMVNVHASGGARMVGAAVEAARKASDQLGVTPPLVIGVTLLTSLSALELAEEMQVAGSVPDYVRRMAQLVQAAGGQGVVASPHEIEAIRAACGPDFLIVTPGVRPAGVDAGDQRRTMTPGEAVQHGADYLVVGRAITADADPSSAAQRIADEIASALA